MCDLERRATVGAGCPAASGRLGSRPVWTNWSGALQSRPRATDRPLDEAGVVAAVRRAADRGQRIRPVGARWSWSPLAVSDDVALDTSALTGIVAFDAHRVRVRAGEKLHDLLRGAGPARPVARRRSPWRRRHRRRRGQHRDPWQRRRDRLAVVAGPEPCGWSTAHGELHRIDGPDLDAVRVGLGALGILTEVDLAVVPERTLAAGEELRPLAELLDEGFLEVHALDRTRGLPRRTRPGAVGRPGRGRAGRGAAASRAGPSRSGRPRPPGRRTRSAGWCRASRRLCGAPRAGGAARRSAPRTACSSRNGRCGPR